MGVPFEVVYGEKKKGNKYGAKKTEYNGHTFDSKHEASVAEAIDWMMLDKYDPDPIVKVEYHVAFPLEVNGTKIGRYTCDFFVTYKSGRTEVWDAKSEPTKKKEGYRLRKKLMKAIHDIDIIEK